MHNLLLMSYSTSNNSDGMFFVSASAVKTSFNTLAINQTIPAGVNNGDCVLAVLCHSLEVTSKTNGWTQVATISSTLEGSESIVKRITIFRKDTVTASNAGASFSVSQSSSVANVLQILVFRSSAGNTAISQTTTTTKNGIVSEIDIDPIFSTGNDIVLCCAGSYVGDDTNTFQQKIIPAGTTLTTGSYNRNRLAISYKRTTLNENINGSFGMRETTNQNSLLTLCLKLSAI